MNRIGSRRYSWNVHPAVADNFKIWAVDVAQSIEIFSERECAAYLLSVGSSGRLHRRLNCLSTSWYLWLRRFSGTLQWLQRWRGSSIPLWLVQVGSGMIDWIKDLQFVEEGRVVSCHWISIVRWDPRLAKQCKWSSGCMSHDSFIHFSLARLGTDTVNRFHCLKGTETDVVWLEPDDVPWIRDVRMGYRFVCGGLRPGCGRGHWRKRANMPNLWRPTKIELESRDDESRHCKWLLKEV